jgi:hypothetical protein
LASRAAGQHSAGRLVVDAIDHIAPKKATRRRFIWSIHAIASATSSTFSQLVHAPQPAEGQCGAGGIHPGSVRKGLLSLTPVRRIRNAVVKDLGLPDDMLSFVNYPTRFDAREATAALKGTGIVCPRLEDYAYRLWDYWERNLDPDLFIDRTLKGQVQGRVVVITGGSSGIGLAAARKIAQAATTVTARIPEKPAAAKRR